MHMLKVKKADIFNNNDNLLLVHNLVKEAVRILRVIIVHTLTSHLILNQLRKQLQNKESD